MPSEQRSEVNSIQNEVAPKTLNSETSYSITKRFLQTDPYLPTYRAVFNAFVLCQWLIYCGTEVGLQLVWAGQQLHPQRFGDVDMVQRTVGFYRRFFDYSLTQAQAQQILAGQAPL